MLLSFLQTLQLLFTVGNKFSNGTLCKHLILTSLLFLPIPLSYGHTHVLPLQTLQLLFTVSNKFSNGTLCKHLILTSLLFLPIPMLCGPTHLPNFLNTLILSLTQLLISVFIFSSLFLYPFLLFSIVLIPFNSPSLFQFSSFHSFFVIPLYPLSSLSPFFSLTSMAALILLFTTIPFILSFVNVTIECYARFLDIKAHIYLAFIMVCPQYVCQYLQTIGISYSHLTYFRS